MVPHRVHPAFQKPQEHRTKGSYSGALADAAPKHQPHALTKTVGRTSLERELQEVVAQTNKVLEHL